MAMRTTVLRRRCFSMSCDDDDCYISLRLIDAFFSSRYHIRPREPRHLVPMRSIGEARRSLPNVDQEEEAAIELPVNQVCVPS